MGNGGAVRTMNGLTPFLAEVVDERGVNSEAGKVVRAALHEITKYDESRLVLKAVKLATPEQVSYPILGLVHQRHRQPLAVLRLSLHEGGERVLSMIHPKPEVRTRVFVTDNWNVRPEEDLRLALLAQMAGKSMGLKPSDEVTQADIMKHREYIGWFDVGTLMEV